MCYKKVGSCRLFSYRIVIMCMHNILKYSRYSNLCLIPLIVTIIIDLSECIADAHVSLILTNIIVSYNINDITCVSIMLRHRRLY